MRVQSSGWTSGAWKYAACGWVGVFVSDYRAEETFSCVFLLFMLIPFQSRKNHWFVDLSILPVSMHEHSANNSERELFCVSMSRVRNAELKNNAQTSQ